MKQAGGLLLLFLCAGLMGCGTMMHGTSQKIPVTAKPEGAVASAGGGAACTTPCILELSRKNDHIISLSKDGYETASVPVRHVLSKAVYGNIVFGLVPGWGVDALSGGQYRLVPETVQAELKPLPKPEPQADAKAEIASKEGAAKPSAATAAAPKETVKEAAAARPPRMYDIAVDGRSDFPVSHRAKKAPRQPAASSPALPRLAEIPLTPRAYGTAAGQPGAFPVSYRVKTTESDEQQATMSPQDNAKGPTQGTKEDTNK